MNEKGRRLIEFCEVNKLVITNIMFQLSRTRLYNRESPGGSVRDEIDFIMIKDRFQNSVKFAKTYPRADITPIITSIKTHTIKTPTKKEKQTSFDLNELKK